jgi:hypothetical protein
MTLRGALQAEHVHLGPGCLLKPIHLELQKEK